MVVFSFRCLVWPVTAAIAWASSEEGTCGAGQGDLRPDEHAFLLCRGCHRLTGHLIFRKDLNFTSCEDCGDGRSDRRKDDSAQAACRKCYGQAARLEYNAMQFSLWTGGSGFTRCVNLEEDDAIAMKHRMSELTDARHRQQNLQKEEFNLLHEESKVLHYIILEHHRLRQEVAPFLRTHHAGDLPDELQERLQDVKEREEKQRLVIQERHKLIHSRQMSVHDEIQFHRELLVLETKLKKLATVGGLRGKVPTPQKLEQLKRLHQMHGELSKPVRPLAFHSLPHLQAEKAHSLEHLQAEKAHSLEHLQAEKAHPLEHFQAEKAHWMEHFQAEKAHLLEYMEAAKATHQQSGTPEKHGVQPTATEQPHASPVQLDVTAGEHADESQKTSVDFSCAIVLSLIIGSAGAVIFVMWRRSSRSSQIEQELKPEPGHPVLLARLSSSGAMQRKDSAKSSHLDSIGSENAGPCASECL